MQKLFSAIKKLSALTLMKVEPNLLELFTNILENANVFAMKNNKEILMWILSYCQIYFDTTFLYLVL